MPIEKTLELLIEISQKENAGYNREGILEIIAMYGTDIRSMINHMQSNKQLSDDLKCRIEPVLYDAIIDNNVPNCEYRIRTICRQHRIHLSQFFKKMFHHIICNYLINNNLLSFMENVLHNENQTIWMKENYLKYVLANIRKLCGKL
jgi:DNA polymerase III delta prime subunit